MSGIRIPTVFCGDLTTGRLVLYLICTALNVSVNVEFTVNTLESLTHLHCNRAKHSFILVGGVSTTICYECWSNIITLNFPLFKMFFFADSKTLNVKS